MKPAAVIFDLYETLITEYDPEWRPGPTLPQRLGLADGPWEREWQARWRARMTGQFPDFTSVLRDVCQTLGVCADERTLQVLHEERIASKTRHFERIDRQVLAMLNALRDRGLRIGVLSNCTPEEVAGWSGSPVATYVQDAVFSYVVGAVKPERDIYELACGRLGIFPDQAVFVGDGGSDELAGAKQAGLQPIWATWFLRQWPPWRWDRVADTAGAYPRCDEPAELLRIVETL